MSNGSSEAAPQIKVATADQATAWIGGGWQIFKKAPGIWIAILLIYLVISYVVRFIPVVGSLTMSLFAPVFLFGWLQGAKDAQAGQELKIEHLFAGFKSPRMGSLVILGLLTLALALGLAMLGGLGVLGMFMGGGEHMRMESIGIGALLACLIMLFAALLIGAAVLFAAPLVGFSGMSPWPAVQLSFAAAIKNWLALLVWSLLALLVMIAGAIPFGLGLLIAIPVLAASYYLAYCDIFGASG